MALRKEVRDVPRSGRGAAFSDATYFRVANGISSSLR